MKRIFLVIFVFLISIVVTSCGESTSEADSSINSNAQKETNNESNSKKESTNTKEIDKQYKELSKPINIDGIGTATIIKSGYCDTFNLDGTDKESKPYKFSELDFTVLQTQVLTLDLNEDGKAFFNANGPLQWITFDVRYYNHSSADILIDNSFSSLSSSKFEDLSFEPALSDDFGGLENSIKSGETKEGVISFIDNTNSPFSSATLDIAIKYAEQKSFKFEYLPLKDAIEKDFTN